MPSSQQLAEPGRTRDQLLGRLCERGLMIPDEARARHYLSFVGYHRLDAYGWVFTDHRNGCLEQQRRFLPGTTFTDLEQLYSFDRELRLLVMDAIERVEVAARSATCAVMSPVFGPLWYLNPTCFNYKPAGNGHGSLIEEIKRQVTRGVRRPRRNGAAPPAEVADIVFPPCWVMAETTSFGTWSRMYAKLQRRYQREIAAELDIPAHILESWLHTITNLRNLCAHHSRLWNRRYGFTPKPLDEYSEHLTGVHFNSRAAMVHILLQRVSPGSSWPGRIKTLLRNNAPFFDSHPNVSLRAMGFREDWHRDPFWGID